MNLLAAILRHVMSWTVVRLKVPYNLLVPSGLQKHAHFLCWPRYFAISFLLVLLIFI